MRALFSTILLTFGLLSIYRWGKLERIVEDFTFKNQTQTLRVNLPDDPTTFDPRKATDLSSTALHFQLYEGLTRITPESTRSLGMAESIEVDDTGLIYLFRLKEVYWSNGQLITAFDFENSWKELIHPKFFSPNSHLMYIVKNGEKIKAGKLDPTELGVQALDKNTLKVELEHPAPYFLDMISFPLFAPFYSSCSDSQPDLPITNGAFKVVQFYPCDELILKKNQRYWAKEEIELNSIQITFIRDEDTVLHLFETNELDLMGTPFTSIPLDSIASYQKSGNLHKHDIGLTIFTTFNVEVFPFNNVHIRKAFAHTIKRDEIVQNITQNNECPATTIIPPSMRKKRSSPLFPLFDAKLGQKELAIGLKELGLKQLPPLTFHYPSIGALQKIAEALEAEWSKTLGVKVLLQKEELKVFLEKITKEPYQFGLYLWLIMYNDEYAIFERFKSKINYRNYPHWQNERYNQLLEASLHEKDPGQRDILLRESEKIMIEEVPLSPIYHGNYVFLEQKNIDGFYLSPIGSPHLQWIKVNKP